MLLSMKTLLIYEDEDVIRKYRYHYMFKFMSDNDFRDFKKNVEYTIDKKTFHELIRNPEKFCCNSRFKGSNCFSYSYSTLRITKNERKRK